MRAFEADAIDRAISRRLRLFESVSPGSHPEDAAAVRDDLSINQSSAGVEDFRVR